MPTGRPTKYNDETVARIINGVRTGLTNKDAALVAGINSHTLTEWEKSKPAFSALLAQARSERSAGWLEELRKAGSKDWRATAELLDRCAPEYRKSTNVDIGNKDGQPFVLKLEVVS